MKFKLRSKYKLIPEQKRAVEHLARGILDDKKYQVLLGVTGSGKSLPYEENVLVYEKAGRNTMPIILPIGELVEANLKKSRRLFAPSINPKNGKQEVKPIIQYTRHMSPKKMYLVTTSCGKEVKVTGDHNFWVLREGGLRLVKTTEIMLSDYLPMPRRLNLENKVHKKGFLIDNLLKRKAYFRISEIKLASALRLKKLLDYQKYYHFTQKNEGLNTSFLHKLGFEDKTLNKIKIFTKNGFELPIFFDFTKELLYLLGLYIAEGHAEKNYLLFSVHEEIFQKVFYRCVKKTKIKAVERKYNKGDFQINNSLLSDVFSNLCGEFSRNKKLPYWFLELSEKQLSWMLSMYFSGDATVASNEIQASSASKKLISDLSYALLRYGIKTRTRKKIKYAANTEKRTKRQYFEIVISGKNNLELFKNKIGFVLRRKQIKLKKIISNVDNTNVDSVPIDGKSFRKLRESLGFSQNSLSKAVDCSRPHISLVEADKRKPSNKLVKRFVQVFEGVDKSSSFTDEINQLKAMSNIFFSKVKEIQVVNPPSKYVYDIAVEENETFLAGMGGIYVHNTFTVANVIEKLQRPTLIISHNKTLAAQLYQELRDFFPENAVSYFVSYYDYYQPEAYIPRTDTYIEKDSDINELIDKLRLAATANILTRRDTIIVASVSCIYNIGSPREYGHFVFEFSEGMKISREAILDRLVGLQYERSDFDFHRGTFRVRGNTIDIYPSYLDEGVSIVLSDNKISEVSQIEPVSGKMINKFLTNFILYPAKHFITDPAKNKAVFDKIKYDMVKRTEQLKAQGKELEAHRLKQKVNYDLEMIQEVGYVKGIENYSRYFDGREPGDPPYSLLDYFNEPYGKDLPRGKAGWLVIADESHMTFPQIRGMYAGDFARKQTLIDYGFRLPAAMDNRPLKFDEFMRRIPNFIATSATPAEWELSLAGKENVVEQLLRPTGIPDPLVEIKPTKTQVADVIEEIKKEAKKKQRTLVTTLTKRTAEDLAEYLQEKGLKVHYLHSDVKTLDRTDILDDLRSGKYDVLVGINLLREGLDLPEVSLVAILDADKEGFLRSDVTLIQTMGRAARHVEGRVIMYADKITGSMQRALDEVKRRRDYQTAMNKKYGVTPRSIEKPIREKLVERDITDQLINEKFVNYKTLPDIDIDGLTPMDKKKLTRSLRREMVLAAQGLDFELAAEIRDTIKKIEIN
ncbi:hypothetical protein A2125_00495 [Candidatus Woesebacteria bacterium GWB1_43_5]|uniref:UvrABC system protein B n=1 Tax=Candidatus Woesebacteria bacterium GWB1_43_5 TaxID=1802474 RepID=A0A1F7WSF5_9BACT|nr:MAG: hypothetical protein A2125_00495 [Candidatus Woesebacteria bacterium GWB1_43_5]